MNLYNKYRPRRFADVAQPHVARVLRAEIARQSEATTYMLTGPSGTGKTTLARVAAMAFMCPHRTTEYEPCGVCDVCQRIRADRHRDVIESNCAINGGVDEIRSLIAGKMNITPERGDYRIFILDEAHMVTPQGQNALLKTMEEPPSYVRFFLCTTDPQKIIGTIANRCQIHRLRKLPKSEIKNILKNVVKEEGVTATDVAINLLAQIANGSPRAALVVLEQVMGVGITEENIREVLGRAPRLLAISLAKAILAINRGEAYQIIEAAELEGRDLAALIEETNRVFMAMIRRVLKTPGSEEDTEIDELLKLCNQGHYLIDIASNLFDIITKIRQNVPADLAGQIGVLKVIDRFAKLKASEKKAG